MITRQFGIPVTSPGAILRREKDLGTPLGQETAGSASRRGGLVSDKIIVELIEDWLRLHGGHGFVFDGFPRTLPQAESLMSILAAVAHRARFGDLARSLGGDCAATVSAGRLQCGALRFHHQRQRARKFAERPVCPYCDGPLVASRRR